jgi:hypothetical protein
VPADYPLANELLIYTYYDLSYRMIFYPAALSSLQYGPNCEIPQRLMEGYLER